MTSLFDDFPRTNTEAASRSQGDFDYLNTTARKGFATGRQMMDEWFSRIPEAHRGELRNRFRSPDRYQHLAAYFELMLHELQICLGCKVELHPAIPGMPTSPDFLATDPANHAWYLEATIATDASLADRGADARESAALDEINKSLSTDVFFEVEVAAIGPRQISGGAVRHFLKQNLNATDVGSLHQSDDWESLPQWHFQEAGWHIAFRPFPRVPPLSAPRGVLGITGPANAHRVTSREALRRAVRRKAGRYGAALDKPYVIAILDASEDRADFVDLMDALFGDEGYRFRVDNLQNPVPFRAANGAWLGHKPINTRNSAVLFCTRSGPWSIFESDAVLVHNAFAQRPYEGSLGRLWQSVPDSSTGEMREVPGLRLSEALGLPTNRPGHDD